MQREHSGTKFVRERKIMKQTTKTWLGIASLLALPGLAGCGGNSSTTANAPTPSPRSVSAAVPDGLTATLAEDTSSISVGGTITYTLTLANNTAQPIIYQPIIAGGTLSRTVPASLIVTDSHGSLIFPVGAVAQFISIGPSTTLVPGQSVSGTVAVGGSSTGQFSAAGQYSASATFAIQTGPDSASQTATAVGPLLAEAH